MTWIADEFDEELRMEQKAQQQELDDIGEMDRNNWQWPDEEQSTSGFYSNYPGKTLKQHMRDIDNLEMGL